MPVKRQNTWQLVCWIAEPYQHLFKSINQLPDILFAKDHLVHRFKDDRTTTVSLINLNDQQLICKRYNARSGWHKIKRAFRRSRARRCWLMTKTFKDAGLQTPETVLMLEERFGPLRKNAIFINEFIDGEILLGQLPKMSGEQQKKVANSLIDAFNKMRQFKISHGDLKASNLLWFEDKLYFIDLDAATQHLSNWGWQQAHQKDKKRFLKNWRNQPELLTLFADM